MTFWKLSDYLNMANILDELEQSQYTLKAFMMAHDKYPVNLYAPPVPMEFETLIWLRRN
jgi:hypothetical protein